MFITFATIFLVVFWIIWLWVVIATKASNSSWTLCAISGVCLVALTMFLVAYKSFSHSEPQLSPVPAVQLLESQLSQLDLPLAVVTPERAVELALNLRTGVHSGRMSLTQYDVSPRFCKIQLLGGAYTGLVSFIYNDIGETGLTDDDSFFYTFSLNNDRERVYLVETNPVSGSKFHVYEDKESPSSVSIDVVSVKYLQDEQFFAQTLRAAALYLIEQELAAKKK